MVRIPIVAGYSYDIDKCGNHTLYYTETREKMELGKNGKGTGEFKEFTARNPIGFRLWEELQKNT